MSQPHFEEVWGWYSHSRNGDLGVLRDSENSEFDYRGQNTLPWSILYIVGKVLKCSLYRWKGLEVFFIPLERSWSVLYTAGKVLKCSLYRWKGLEVFFIPLERSWSVDVENGVAWALRTSAAQVMDKKGLGVKLAIWVLIIESRESTQPRCVQVECDTLLESYKGKLQVCFRPHPDQRSEQGVVNIQSLGSPNRDNFGTPLWESREKMSFECRCHGQTQRILHGGRWWLPPSPGCGESCESKVAMWLVLTLQVLTNVN
jgi:hypothetical protein